MTKQRTRRLLLPERLPYLRGRGLLRYNMIWAAMLIAAIAMTGIGAWKGFTPMQYGWMNYGLAASGEARTIAVVTGAEAAAKGISPGDSILAIDDIPVEQIDASWVGIRGRLAKPEGETIALTLRDSEGRTVTHSLRSSAANTAPAERIRGGATAASLLTQLALLSAGFLLFRRRREPVPAVLALAFVTIAVTASSDAMLWLDQVLLERILSVLGFGLLLLGLLVFPDGRFGTRASRLIAACIVFWGVSLSLVPDSRIYYGGLAALLVAVGVRQLLAYRRMQPGNERQQVRWAIFGFACGIMFLAISLTCYAVAMRIGGTAFQSLALVSTVTSTIGTFCMVGGLLVSLMRYRLYDADAVIGRSAAYGILTVGFLALFAGGEKVIEKLGESYFGGQVGALAGGLAAAFAAVLIAPLHRRVSDWAERRFQKQLLYLRRGLPQLVGDLRETASVDVISQAVANAVAGGVQASRAAVLIDDEIVAVRSVSAEAVQEWAQNRDIADDGQSDGRRDPLFPMRLPLEAEAIGRVGWLVLGPRPDGSSYGKDEREVLAEIADPVARAIKIAQTREQRDNELLGRIKVLEDIVAGSGNPVLHAANA